jgi:hypothetical protein
MNGTDKTLVKVRHERLLSGRAAESNEPQRVVQGSSYDKPNHKTAMLKMHLQPYVDFFT